MYIFLKNFLLLIPNYINVLYCKTNKLLILKYKLKVIYLKLIVSYYLLILNKRLFFKINSHKINIITFIKKLLFEMLVKTYKKLNLIGIGFKVNILNNFLNYILVFKLELSHFIYLKIPNNMKCFCLQYNKIFLISNILNIMNLIYSIKLFKFTNNYTEKGIFYYNETLKLKKNKAK